MRSTSAAISNGHLDNLNLGFEQQLLQQLAAKTSDVDGEKEVAIRDEQKRDSERERSVFDDHEPEWTGENGLEVATAGTQS